MPEKPTLQDEEIIKLLQDAYDLNVTSISFLPLGHDPNAWVYKVSTDADSLFLKVKKGRIYPPSVEIPHFLQDVGFKEAIAPLLTKTGSLWVALGDFFLIVYPFIDGQTGMSINMSNLQWKTFGSTLKKLHSIQFNNSSNKVTSESFIPKWSNTAKELHSMILEQDTPVTDPYRKKLISFWSKHYEEISSIVARAEALGQIAKTESLDFVLCHSDIHTDNILFSLKDDLFIIDWDDPILAPRERDLMFVVGKNGEQPFFDGYGTYTPNPIAIAYYCYEWVVQEIGEYGKLILLDTEVSEIMKKESLQSFKELFDRGNVVEFAYKMDPEKS